MDELNVNEIEMTEDNMEVTQNESNNELGKKVAKIGLGVLIVGGSVCLIRKFKDKISKKLEERMVKKLEKKGYTVMDLRGDDDENENKNV